MSKTTDTTLWGIHAGKSGDADRLFLKDDCIGLGWVTFLVSSLVDYSVSHLPLVVL